MAVGMGGLGVAGGGWGWFRILLGVVRGGGRCAGQPRSFTEFAKDVFVRYFLG